MDKFCTKCGRQMQPVGEGGYSATTGELYVLVTCPQCGCRDDSTGNGHWWKNYLRPSGLFSSMLDKFIPLIRCIKCKEIRKDPIPNYHL